MNLAQQRCESEATHSCLCLMRCLMYLRTFWLCSKWAQDFLWIFLWRKSPGRGGRDSILLLRTDGEDIKLFNAEYKEINLISGDFPTVKFNTKFAQKFEHTQSLSNKAHAFWQRVEAEKFLPWEEKLSSFVRIRGENITHNFNSSRSTDSAS